MKLDNLISIQIKDIKSSVPQERGIYFWIDNKTNYPVYIGKAKNLRKRMLQHLNPKYLEYRASKHTIKDSFQLRHAIKRPSKDGSTIREGIDKSVFRRSIGRKLKLKSGNETVDYITKKCCLKVLVYKKELSILESCLIKKYQPEFNTVGKLL